MVPKPGSAGSGVTFEFPKNYFVWEKLKIDSPPYKPSPDLHEKSDLVKIFLISNTGPFRAPYRGLAVGQKVTGGCQPTKSAVSTGRGYEYFPQGAYRR